MLQLFPFGKDAKIGLLPKLIYTAYVAVLVPFYLKNYGPTNFIFFCDCSLLLGMAALWTESSLLASMPAVGIVVIQMLWCVDFALGFFGHGFGLAGYMFDSAIPLYMRGLSLFHGWLPWVLLWVVHRLGYDSEPLIDVKIIRYLTGRALVAWTALAYVLLFVSYNFMPPPPAPASNPDLPVNINLVFGPVDTGPQTWMSPLAWVASETAILTVIFLVTHLVLRRFMPSKRPR
jgi:hypothetical protein